MNIDGIVFYVCILGDYEPATHKYIKEKAPLHFCTEYGEYLEWEGPYPEPPKKSTPAIMPIVESENLPVSVIADMFTDMRLAAIFAQQFREEIRYWQESGKWLVFDGRRWTTDAPGGAFPFIRRMIESLHQKATDCSDYQQRADMRKAIMKLEDHRRQVTVLSAAQVRPELIISAAKLDHNPMLLTCTNGSIDLQSGVLRSHRADDYMTRMVSVEYNEGKKCPKFMQFLNRIFDEDRTVVEYLQRFAGYCLTGRTDAQVLLFFYGLGCNGKSVLANVLGALLGDYSSTAGSDLLMSRDNRSSTNDIAALRGSRLVKVSEFDDSERLAEAQIKTLTGGDPVTCRFLYCENFTYVPTYKILLIGNHKPKIYGTDHGIWRRLHLLNFGVTIPEAERNPNLQDELLQELPGILAWAVQGCLQWQKQGLAAPDAIKAATEEYRKSEDLFQLWIDECCTTGSQCVAAAAELLTSFIEYSKLRATSSTKFGRMLADAGYLKEKTGGVIWWRGLSLPQQDKHRHWQERDEPF
ncbi:MAG: DNA primase family protein [Desulfuromonadaceae bacterium]